jgi:hypothetical protein
MIRLVSSDELAQSLGYSTANDAFRSWCAKLRITPVPGRRGYYDEMLVRRRLDEAQGLVGSEAAGGSTTSFVEMRRARRGKN